MSNPQTTPKHIFETAKAPDKELATLKVVNDHPLSGDPRVNKVAKAIAWVELTDLGKRNCQWPQDFARTEIEKFRMMAIAAMEELNVG